MAIYFVHENAKLELEAKITKVNQQFAEYDKSGGSQIAVQFSEDPTIQTWFDADGHEHSGWCYEVQLTGAVKNDKYALVGSLHPQDNDGMSDVRLNTRTIYADNVSENDLSRFIEDDGICEECGVRNNRRKEYWLIRNNETDEIKKVGTTCIDKYFPELDMNFFAKSFDELFTENEDDKNHRPRGYAASKSSKYVDGKLFAAYVYEVGRLGLQDFFNPRRSHPNKVSGKTLATYYEDDKRVCESYRPKGETMRCAKRLYQVLENQKTPDVSEGNFTYRMLTNPEILDDFLERIGFNPRSEVAQNAVDTVISDSQSGRLDTHHVDGSQKVNGAVLQAFEKTTMKDASLQEIVDLMNESLTKRNLFYCQEDDNKLFKSKSTGPYSLDHYIEGTLKYNERGYTKERPMTLEPVVKLGPRCRVPLTRDVLRPLFNGLDVEIKHPKTGQKAVYALNVFAKRDEPKLVLQGSEEYSKMRFKRVLGATSEPGVFMNISKKHVQGSSVESKERTQSAYLRTFKHLDKQGRLTESNMNVSSHVWLTKNGHPTDKDSPYAVTSIHMSPETMKKLSEGRDVWLKNPSTNKWNQYAICFGQYGQSVYLSEKGSKLYERMEVYRLPNKGEPVKQHTKEPVKSTKNTGYPGKKATGRAPISDTFEKMVAQSETPSQVTDEIPFT